MQVQPALHIRGCHIPQKIFRRKLRKLPHRGASRCAGGVHRFCANSRTFYKVDVGTLRFWEPHRSWSQSPEILQDDYSDRRACSSGWTFSSLVTLEESMAGGGAACLGSAGKLSVSCFHAQKQQLWGSWQKALAAARDKTHLENEAAA